MAGLWDRRVRQLLLVKGNSSPSLVSGCSARPDRGAIGRIGNLSVGANGSARAAEPSKGTLSPRPDDLHILDLASQRADRVPDILLLRIRGDGLTTRWWARGSPL